jgi:hypothetical protein
MRLLFEPPPLYFMHVPKTGGVALRQWLRCAYRRGYFDLDLPQLTKLTDRSVQDFRCYHAWHHGRSMFDWLGRSDLVVFTLLRDPIERVVSAFKFRQRRLVEAPTYFKQEYLALMRPIQSSRIEECLDHELITHMLSNGQVRLLGIREDYATFLTDLRQNRQDDALLQPYAVSSLIDCDNLPLLYTNARSWLDEMAVVGLTERYAESLLMIGDLLGIPVPTDQPRANVNPERTDATLRYQDQLAPDVVARLEELNRYDLDLYTHATELFEQQWARYQARPRRTYSIAAHLRPRLQPVKAVVKRIIRWQPRQTWKGA